MHVEDKVRSESLDDELCRRVAKFLFSQHFPVFRKLDIGVECGTVTLAGEVHSYYEKQIAMNSCQHVVGVLSFIDEIVVTPKSDSFKN